MSPISAQSVLIYVPLEQTTRSVELSAERGGNSRVGMEDNIFLSKGVLAKGNFELVAEAAKRAKAKGRVLASPKEARELLRLT